MATFTATMAQRGNSSYTAGPAGQEYTAYSSYTMTAAPATNDVYEMLRVPARARITSVTLKSTDIDTNVTPTVVLDVGDSADTDRLIDGATIGQTGGTSSALVSSTGQFYQYTSETVISVLIQAGPATGAAGTLELAVSYVLQ